MTFQSGSTAVPKARRDPVDGQKDAFAHAGIGVAGAAATDQLDLDVVERLDIGHAQADEAVQLGIGHGTVWCIRYRRSQPTQWSW